MQSPNRKIKSKIKKKLNYFNCTMITRKHLGHFTCKSGPMRFDKNATIHFIFIHLYRKINTNLFHSLIRTTNRKRNSSNIHNAKSINTVKSHISKNTNSRKRHVTLNRRSSMWMFCCFYIEGFTVGYCSGERRGRPKSTKDKRTQAAGAAAAPAQTKMPSLF